MCSAESDVQEDAGRELAGGSAAAQFGLALLNDPNARKRTRRHGRRTLGAGEWRCTPPLSRSTNYAQLPPSYKQQSSFEGAGTGRLAPSHRTCVSGRGRMFVHESMQRSGREMQGAIWRKRAGNSGTVETVETVGLLQPVE
jgi:hypothetical protein